MRMSVGLRECGARSNPYIAKVLEKRRKKWLGRKTWPFFETMRTNSDFSRYSYRNDFRKEGTR